MKGLVKKIAVIALSLCICIVPLGCASDEYSHTHTFFNEWECDKTYHWHEASCAHSEEISGKARHDFEGNVCTVCGYSRGTSSAEKFTDNTRVKQASNQVRGEDGVNHLLKAEYISSVSYGGIAFVQYYIGSIYNCFIQTVTQPTYYDGGVKLSRYIRETVTSRTVCEGIGNSISTTDSVSVSQSNKSTLSWKFGTSSTLTASASVTANVCAVSATAGVSETIATAAELGGSLEVATANTISKSVADSSYKNLDVSEFEEKREQAIYDIDMSIYPTGYYYALSIVADIDVYQVVAYREDSGEFYTTYFTTDIDGNAPSLKMLASDSASFKIPSEYQLFPVTEIEITDADDVITVNPTEPIPVSFTVKNCALDNGFNPGQQAGEEDDRNRHNGFDVVNLSIGNVRQVDGKYRTVTGLEPRLFLTVKQNIGNIPINNSEASLKCIENDTYKGAVHGTDINGATIGYGAYYVQVNYTDGTTARKNAVNLLSGMVKGDTIDLGLSFDKTKTISGIEVIVVYEITTGAPGFLGIWWFEHSNWRCDASMQFLA